MITHARASLSMDWSIKNAQKSVTREGFLYPSLFLLNKGKPIITNYEHPSILHVDHDEDTHNPNTVYKTIFLFKNITKEDENSINIVAKELTRKTNPDAVGLIMVVLYRELSVKEYKNLSKDYQAGLDPESMRAVHGCYYIKADKNPAMILIPFVDRTVTIDLEPEGPDLGIPKPKRDIIFVESTWRYKDKSLDPWLKYPY